MISREQLEEQYKNIFDENQNLKTADEEYVREFCNNILGLTGIQVCNKYGDLYDYIHKVYKASLNILAGRE